jgi:hypothetical protein
MTSTSCEIVAAVGKNHRYTCYEANAGRARLLLCMLRFNADCGTSINVTRKERSASDALNDRRVSSSSKYCMTADLLSILVPHLHYSKKVLHSSVASFKNKGWQAA